MATIRIKIVAEGVRTINKEDYKDEWQEFQEENEEVAEGEDAGEPSDDFVRERYQTALEDGDFDLDEVLEAGSVEVTIVR